jgi:putative transposase
LLLFMSKSQPDIRIRHAVATWPDDSPRGAVTAFCRKHNVSRAWFYRVRAEAAEVGPVKALEKRPTLPSTMPTMTAPAMIDLLLGAREELKELGLDHGPLSVMAKLSRQGFRPPSRATVARIFARAGVVVPEPRKKPRSAYKRFVYPQPNACWQIDSTEWQLAGGRKVAIFQLIDDHSRLALASLVATGETSEAAIAVVTLAIERHGAPQKFLSDNGSALNPTRRGRTGALVEFLKARGTEPITGKPYKPTTQGKNERFHQTLHRYLHRQPPAPSIATLQLQVDAFDLYYNNEREHQGLPPGMTPREALGRHPKDTSARRTGNDRRRTGPAKRATDSEPERVRDDPGNPFQTGQRTHRNDRAHPLRRRRHHVLRSTRHRNHQPPQAPARNPLRRQRQTHRGRSRPPRHPKEADHLPAAQTPPPNATQRTVHTAMRQQLSTRS